MLQLRGASSSLRRTQKKVKPPGQKLCKFYGALATRGGSCRFWRCDKTPGLVSGAPRRQRRKRFTRNLIASVLQAAS